jgi:ribosomal protein L29
MKKSELQQIKNISGQELQKKLHDYQERLRKLKVDLFYGKVKNIREIKDVKKIIARIKGLIQERKP